MKKIAAILFSLFVIWSSANSQTLNEKINSIHNIISVDSVTNYIQSLENFGSRFEYNDERIVIANWLKDQFLSMGFQQVELDSFMCNTSINGTEYEGMQYNVVATLPGSSHPDEIYVIGGHYDSFNTSPEIAMNVAPGADDNASGTTAVLETARAIMAAGYQPESTIQFVCFAAEELMLFGYSGSEYMAESRRAQNINIKLMINNDMIANNPHSLEESRVHINFYSGYEHLRDIAKSLTEQYTVVTPLDGAVNQWSDSRPFHDQNYPAIYFEEYDFSPYYHTENDRIDNYDMEFCTEVIKASSAMLVYSIETPSIISGLVASDVGDGSSIELKWSAIDVSDLFAYKIFKGTDKENMNYLSSTNDTSFIIDNLTTGSSYYFGVSSIDVDGNESILSIVVAKPNFLPLSPNNVTAEAKWESINLSWKKNNELDLLTYKIYKVPVTTYDYFPNLTYYTTDTTFTDTEIESGLWYEYQVAAVDADSNESTNNALVDSRAVTLDKGILFVNETSYGDGSIGNPSLDQIENFYYSLPNSNFEMYDVSVNEEESFSLANLAAHQTVVWHIDKSGDVNTYQYLDIVKEYLGYGGNLLFTGYKPSKAFTYSTSMIIDYSEGDFLFDYLDVTQSENSILALFKSGQNVSTGYPNLELDLNKISTADEHIKTVEVMHPNNAENIIYSYVTDYDPTTVKGIFSGKPIGVEYLSEDYNAILLSVPLYYIKQEQASEFLNFVLTNKFDTPTEIKEEHDEKLNNSFYLSQNYPNPFNPTTRIKYQVASIEKVSLKIYDILGREIANLVNELKAPGTYDVEFDASKLSSGIYFYKLTSGNFVETKKMMLIK